MDNEVVKKEQSHDVSIALIQRDITYIRESLTKIDTTLSIFDRNFARKEELKAIEKSILEIHTDLKKELGKKVDHMDFDPIKKTLQKINWLMITGIVVALLALVIK